jgi:internalin A
MTCIRLAMVVVALAGVVTLAGCEVKFSANNKNEPDGPNNQKGGDPEKKAPEYIDPKTKKDKADIQLERLKGHVTRDKSKPDHPIVAIKLFSEDVTDDDLKELAQFPTVKRLEVSGKITGTGFAHLTGLELDELYVGWAKELNNDGMKELAKLKSLKILTLPQGKFDDDGLKEIQTLTNLEELTVSGFKIGDRGFYPLKTLTKLRKVNANNCNVGDGAMKVLCELPEMRVLELYGSKVTDTGYEYVGKMAKLEELRTSYNITDKGVAHFGNLKNLRKLSVWNSSVTIKGIRALPNLKNLKDLDISTWNITAQEADKLRGELTDCNVAFDKK